MDDRSAGPDGRTAVRQPGRLSAGIIFTLAVLFSLFHLYAALIGGLASQLQRSIHLAFTLALVFLLYPPPARRRAERRIPWHDVVLAAAGGFVGLYWLLFFDQLVRRAGNYNALDLAVGALAVLLVLEASRRAVGKPITIVVACFLLYALLGPHFPGMLSHSGISLPRLFSHMYFTTEGIFGTPLAVSSTFIFLFLLFGAILEKTGVGEYFNDLALLVAGRASGGPAKVTIFSSALQGTISGSSVANVVTSGAFTIPLMKRLGYRPSFAAAVEATSSTGGQIMPPVMGAAAFLMAEFTGIPYWTIAVSAAIPALLFFAGIWIMTHFEAKRLGLRGLAKEELPDARQVLKRLYLLLPLVAIVAFLSTGMSPMRAALYGIFTAIAVGFVQPGPNRLTPRRLLDALADGARSALGVAAACAAAGMIVGVIVLTGIGLKFAAGLIDLSGGLSLVTLMLAMLACLVLGMGVPTTANYVITATIAAPVLVKLGFSLLPAHMFVFYFGILADLTPPVALAAYAASGIAGSRPLKTGAESTRIAIAAFLIPYIFVYSPQLLLQDVHWGGAIWITAGAMLGMIGVGAAAIGYWSRPLPLWMRPVLFISGLLLVVPEAITSACGLIGMAAVYALHLRFPAGKKQPPPRQPAG